jgi:hypothetical protein
MVHFDPSINFVLLFGRSATAMENISLMGMLIWQPVRRLFDWRLSLRHYTAKEEYEWNEADQSHHGYDDHIGNREGCGGQERLQE